MTTTHAIVNPWAWQEAYGFVQAHAVTEARRTLYCAGQTAVDDDGRPLHAGDMPAQLAKAVDNLEAVLAAGDATLADVVRLNYYVTDLPAFFRSLEALKDRLQRSGCRPASTLLNVAALHHPDILVEIEATAVV